MSPFEALFSYAPPLFPAFLEATSVPAVNSFLQDRTHLNQLLHENLVMAQNRMKQIVDAHRTERQFDVGDFVYLKLQPYRQSSLALRKNLKLSAKFYGPFQILQKVGQVTYKLLLLVGCHLHPVFHVSLLKKYIGANQPLQPSLPVTTTSGQIIVELLAILNTRTIMRNNLYDKKFLVQWKNLDFSNNTWEDEAILKS